jgi:4-amino-4-deoxychorismate lyase
MILINGETTDRINVLDRGLQYGDGLFETIAYRNNQLELLDGHLSRLIEGCQRLRISTKFLSQLEQDLKTAVSFLTHDAIVKIVVTRGVGGRGYRLDPDSRPTCIISTHDMPSYPTTYGQGVSVRYCEQRVSENETLAGIKHLNRLEQVIARSEWDEPDIAEGLMFNRQEQLIEGTMTNVFAVKNNIIHTPELSFSGVKGVMRQRVIELAQQLGLEVKETVISKADIFAYDEIFLTNSIIQIWPVTRLESLKFDYGEITQRLQAKLV